MEPPGAASRPGQQKRWWSAKIKRVFVWIFQRFYGKAYLGRFIMLDIGLGLSVFEIIALIIITMISGGTEKDASTEEAALRRIIQGNRNEGFASAALELTIVAVAKTL